jgi:uncharacterized protein (TIGR02145 family)
MLFLTLQSCHKERFENGISSIPEFKGFSLPEQNYVVYYGPETFTITSKENFDVTRALANENFENFENFVLKVQNGTGGKTKVNKIEIIIDGTTIVTHNDFIGNKLLITKPFTGLNSNSILRVKLAGSKGRFVKISIEGILKSGIIADIDGNYYRTVKICGKWWMSENLRATRFNDGTEIKNVTDNSEWEGLGKYHTPAYCWYNNDVTNKNIYGALYSEGSVNRVNGKNVCPVGWHVAGNEWFTMIHCLDPDANDWGILSLVAGKLVNETGNLHWTCPDNPSTNVTGLSIIPGGSRFINDPPFNAIGQIGLYWTGANGVVRFYCEGVVSFSEGWDDYGFSVRCVKDE